MKKFNQPEEYTYQKAKRQAKEIKGFYYHLVCYCTVIPFLIFINLKFVPEFHWFWFSLIGWGTGLLFHAIEVFNLNPFLGKKWQERKLQQFMDEERAKQQRINEKLKE